MLLLSAVILLMVEALPQRQDDDRRQPNRNNNRNNNNRNNNRNNNNRNNNNRNNNNRNNNNGVGRGRRPPASNSRSSIVFEDYADAAPISDSPISKTN